MAQPSTLPLVYSCSGCSSAAQTANAVALQLDRDGVAEMSCIAGVGGGVAPLVRLARSGRAIVAIDGCALACTRACLARQGVEPTHHVLLPDLGVRKKYHTDPDQGQIPAIVHAVAGLLAQPAIMEKETT